MIKSFSKISGTGKFYNYQPSNIPPQHQFSNFAHFNLIYGENGSGKTTLAQILRSLKGDSPLLLQKRSFKKDKPQVVQIETDAVPQSTFIYQQEKWNAHYGNLEIFDVHFINENIYTGLEIQTSHKKNLFDIILGEGGIQLKNDIQHIKLRIRNGNKIVRDTIKTLEAMIDHAYTAQEYAQLKPDIAIDERITDKQKELETAQSFQQILEQAALWELPRLTLPYDVEDTKAMLQTSIDNISSTYLEKVKSHKEHLGMNGKGEEWLKQGFEAMQDETCPFCCQNLDNNVAIIEAYQQYFNARYNTLIKNIRTTHQALDAFNIEVILLDTERKITANQTLIAFWKNHLPNPPALHSQETEHTALLETFTAVKEAIKKKSQQPIQSQSIEILNTMMDLLESYERQIAIFNSNIAAFNENIHLLKTSYTPNIPQLEKDLKQLFALKKRDQKEVVQHCNNLILYQGALEKLAKMKDDKQSALNIFKSSIFTTYLAKINGYLQSFAPYLEIRNLTSTYMGSSTEPSVKFALRVHGTAVNHKEHATKISMKYALSEGDKSALALSFFLAKLDLDEQLEEKVIVFDDPVSSFDHHRLATMLDTLVHLGKRAKQVFFLSHNVTLVQEYWNLVQLSGRSHQSCRIGYLEESSCLVRFEVEKELGLV